MTPGAASALLQMSTSVTEGMAARWARLAADRGATSSEIDQAWQAWDAERDSAVQVIGGAA